MSNSSKRLIVILSLFAVGMSGSITSAELNGPFTSGFSFAFPQPVGDTSNVLNHGFGFGFNFGYRPETSPLGLSLDMIYSNFDLTSDVLNQINRADSGYATVWGFDLSAVLTPRNVKHVRPRLQIGPGFYYEYAQASRFSGGGGYVCDPWFGCYPVSSSETLVDWSTWRLGWMGGAGIDFEFDSGGSLFLQAQYHLINNANADTELIPVSFGYQWSF